MVTLRNKRELAAVDRESQEEHPRNSQSRDAAVPRIQVSVEIEGRVTRVLSLDCSRTKSRIVDALSMLEKLLFTHTSRSNQEPF